MTASANQAAAEPPRIALGLQYDGTDFCGWQVQPEGRTVQRVLEQALSSVASSPVATVCAGRTDSGVHALGQVVHFDPPCVREIDAWMLGTNANLPADAAVGWVKAVDPGFHARFGALSRHYCYLILNRPTRAPLYRQRAHYERRPLDVESMAQAATALLGEHDFSAFRAASCQAHNPRRIVHSLRVTQRGPWVRIDIEANAFLQNMVRIIAGSLLRVGRGDASPQWLGQVLADRDRQHHGATAPAHGLYFVAARYPAKYALPPPAPDLLTGP